MPSVPSEVQWQRYVPGETVLEFGRSVVAIGPRGHAVVFSSQDVGDYRPIWIFVLPRIPPVGSGDDSDEEAWVEKMFEGIDDGV